MLYPPNRATPEPAAAVPVVPVASPVPSEPKRPVPLADPYFAFKTTASGLRYRVNYAGDGPRARAQDYVVVRYRVTHPPTGLELDATPKDEPLGFVLWSGTVFRGLDEGVAGMRVGGQRTLMVPAELLDSGLIGVDGTPLELPDTTLRVDVELVSVLPGIRKRTKQPGSGPVAMPGDTVRMHWALYVGDATVPALDSRQFGAPTTVMLGAGDIIAGMELGVAGMAKGEVADLFIPPYLGYGAEGAAAGLVPPHAAVRCRVELLDVLN